MRIHRETDEGITVIAVYKLSRKTRRNINPDPRLWPDRNDVEIELRRNCGWSPG